MKIISCILMFISFSISSFGQKLNFDAIDKYFSITDSLRKDIPLSDYSWKALLSSTGVQLYIKNNSLDEQALLSFKRNFELAYMPKNDSILKARLKEPEKYFKLWVFNNYKTKESELKAYYQNIKSNNSEYLDSIYSKCYQMLPKRMHQKATNTTIYFIPLMNDAVAEGTNIVLTLYGAYYFDKLKYGVLGGHEIHHILRKNKTIDKIANRYLFDALTLLLNEGTADLIDKKYTALDECPEDLKYYEYIMQNAPSSLALLDTAIMAHIDKTKEITKANLPNIVPMSGHIPGCYMATVIEKNGFKQELIAAIDNPYQFVMLYQKAAKKDKEKPYLLSDKTMAYIKKLNQKGSH